MVFPMVSRKKDKKEAHRFTARDSMVLEMELEVSKLRREKSVFVLNKSIFLYFFFIFLGVVGLLTGYESVFNTLVILGLLSIIIGSIPYLRIMHSEEKNLEEMLDKLRRLN